MSNFIELTEKTAGNKIFININTIVYIENAYDMHKNEYSRIHLLNDKTISVEESRLKIQTIINKI